MQTIQAQISDAVIKRNTNKPIRQISDTRYPIKFRYGKNREKGSWHVVQYKGGKAIWRKVGSYPALNSDRVIKRLPDIMAEMAINPDSSAVSVGRFETVADLMNWYIDRAKTARHLSDRRRSAIASIGNKHIIGKLGSCRIIDVDHGLIDELLIVPMQAEYSLAYTRQVYDILRLSFKQAHKLRLIEHNPIGGFKFTDFITTSIKPRDGRLKSNNLQKLLKQIDDAGYQGEMLAVMMLLHGTRIGETLRIRYDWIHWGDRTLLIPAEVTKTREPHTIPLTDLAIAAIKRYRWEQEYNGYKGIYLFPDGKGGHVTDGRASEMIRAVANGDWKAHDLRKMARTCWMDLGIDYMVGERLLNHKMSKLDQAYIHTHVEDQKRAALEKYHQWLRKNGFSRFIKDI